MGVGVGEVSDDAAVSDFLVDAFLVVLDEAVVDFLAFLSVPVAAVVSVLDDAEVETDSLFAVQEVKNPMAARTVMQEIRERFIVWWLKCGE